MPAPLNLLGQKFGRLTVVSFAYTKYRNSYWNCVCECGNEKIVSSGNLKKGITVSCGCYQKEMARQKGKATVRLMIEKNLVYNTRKGQFSMGALSNSSSGIRGVYLKKDTGKFGVEIMFQKRKYRLGYFSILEEAIQARHHAESVLWGDFSLGIKEENPELAAKVEAILATKMFTKEGEKDEG